MNSRFSIAVHILTLLASAPGERMTSEIIAASVGTNPVIIRRQLASLRKARIVRSTGARGGGWELTHGAETICLSDIKKALEEETSFKMHRNEPHPNCIVGENVRAALRAVYDDAEHAVMTSLEDWTVQDILSSVKKRRQVDIGTCS